eukprot:tig00020961_g16637.t1
MAFSTCGALVAARPAPQLQCQAPAAVCRTRSSAPAVLQNHRRFVAGEQPTFLCRTPVAESSRPVFAFRVVNAAFDDDDDDKLRASAALGSFSYEVFGRVQGVYFRAFTQKKAQELGVVGYVQNTSRGTVEGVAQGPHDALAALESWLANEGSPFGSLKLPKIRWVKAAKSAFNSIVREDPAVPAALQNYWRALKIGGSVWLSFSVLAFLFKILSSAFSIAVAAGLLYVAYQVFFVDDEDDDSFGTGRKL